MAYPDSSYDATDTVEKWNASSRKRLTELAPPPARHFLFWVYANSKIRKKIPRVEPYENIRRAVNFEGLSIRGAASKFKVHRREVRNALASSIPRERKVVPKRRPKLGQYEATVRKWLAVDADLPRNQRHTTTRIWERLIDDTERMYRLRRSG